MAVPLPGCCPLVLLCPALPSSSVLHATLGPVASLWGLLRLLLGMPFDFLLIAEELIILDPLCCVHPPGLLLRAVAFSQFPNTVRGVWQVCASAGCRWEAVTLSLSLQVRATL